MDETMRADLQELAAAIEKLIESSGRHMDPDFAKTLAHVYGQAILSAKYA
jgi:hypothetical protein